MNQKDKKQENFGTGALLNWRKNQDHYHPSYVSDWQQMEPSLVIATPPNQKPKGFNQDSGSHGQIPNMFF